MEYQVLPGHSVLTGKTYLPGESVELSDKEGKRLIGAGIVAKAKENATEQLQVKEVVKLIEAAQDTDALAEFVDDERPGVVKAVEKRGKELAAAASAKR